MGSRPCVKEPCCLPVPFLSAFFLPREKVWVCLSEVFRMAYPSGLTFTCRCGGTLFCPSCGYPLCYLPVLGLAHVDSSTVLFSFLNRGRVLSAQQKRLWGPFDQPECVVRQALQPHKPVLTPLCKSCHLFRTREFGRYLFRALEEF